MLALSPVSHSRPSHDGLMHQMRGMKHIMGEDRVGVEAGSPRSIAILELQSGKTCQQIEYMDRSEKTCGCGGCLACLLHHIVVQHSARDS